VSDPTTARTNSFFLNNNAQDQDGQSSFEPQGPGSLLRPSTQPHHHSLNLRDALEWLLGAATNPEDDHMSHEEKSARSNRRMELMMWLLNLEPRLAPYGE